MEFDYTTTTTKTLDEAVQGTQGEIATAGVWQVEKLVLL